MRKLIFAIKLFFASFLVFGLPDSWDSYLIEQCHEVGIPVPVVRAILFQENRRCNPDACPFNKDGSQDLGLFQLNSNYLWKDFVPNYWDREDEFRWNDPFHSTYIAVRHIKWLYGVYNNPSMPTIQSRTFMVALAYNCGVGAVFKGRVPNASVDYAAAVVYSAWGVE
jgi:hypothetical protein